MLKELFAEQRAHIDRFFEGLSDLESRAFFDALKDCKGLIILSGVGKSGLVAEKIAMTLTSTGTRALFISPTNFLHGDIGIISSEDLVIFLSKSGETEELLNLIPFIRRRKAPILSLVSKRGSRLAALSDLSVYLPLQKELCPFDLAPTTSTSLQLIFGDVMAVALMKAKQFKLDDYAQNHPFGAIGKKMTLTVEDVMLQGSLLPLCSMEDSLADILVELTNKKCGCMLVVDEQMRLQGIFTDGDLRRALQQRGEKVLSLSMKELMTPEPLMCVEKEMLAQEAIILMQLDPKKWVMVLPVVEEGRVVGMIRMHDIIQAGVGGAV